MDKNKQFTQNAHEIGSMVHPEPSSKLPDILKDADLSSDFDVGVDPNGMHQDPVVTNDAPKEAPKEAPANEEKVQELKPRVAATSAGGVPAAAITPAATGKIGELLKNPYAKWGLAGFGVFALMTLSVLIGLRFASKPAQLVADTAEMDKSTLLIDSEKHTVGIRSTANPDGLQVGATVTTTPQGTSNIRMGLLDGNSASLLFEDGKNNLWQITNTEGALEFIQGTQGRAKLDANALSLANALNVGGQTNANGGLNVPANTTLGKDGGNTLTIQGNKVAIPNGLNFDDNTLVINAATNTVAVGAASAGSYKLLVNGTFKANGSIFTDGQVLAGAGSARGPSYTFNNNTTSGLFSPSANMVGISAGGTEVLRVQPGAVIAIGSSIEADGYIRAGRGGNNPGFQVSRYTGTLDGSGGATVGSGLSAGNSRVLTADAWYRGNSNEAMPMSVDYVGGGDFRISGGIPGRQYRASLIYSQDNAGW